MIKKNWTMQISLLVWNNLLLKWFYISNNYDFCFSTPIYFMMSLSVGRQHRALEIPKLVLLLESCRTLWAFIKRL